MQIFRFLKQHYKTLRLKSGGKTSTGMEISNGKSLEELIWSHTPKDCHGATPILYCTACR